MQAFGQIVDPDLKRPSEHPLVPPTFTPLVGLVQVGRDFAFEA